MFFEKQVEKKIFSFRKIIVKFLKYIARSVS